MVHSDIGRPKWCIQTLGDPYGAFRHWATHMVHSDIGQPTWCIQTSGDPNGAFRHWATHMVHSDSGRPMVHLQAFSDGTPGSLADVGLNADTALFLEPKTN